MKKIFIHILLIAFIFFLISCGGGGGGGDGGGDDSTDNSNSAKLSKMNISDAKNLYIAKTSSNFMASIGLDSNELSFKTTPNSTEGKLFKITEDGYAEEVKYLDENEQIVSDFFIPNSLIKLNEKYIIVCFSNGDNYLVNIETEACYKYTEDIPYFSSYNAGLYNGEITVNDANGNIYFLANGKLLKLNVSNPQNVSLQSLLPPNESVSSSYSWSVDDNGNIAYEGRDNVGNGTLRFKSVSNGYSNLPGSTNFSFTMFWQGLDGLIYYFNQSNPGEKIKKINSNPFSPEDCNVAANALGSAGACGFNNLLKAKNKNRMILLADGSAYPEFYEVYNSDTNTITRIAAGTVGLQSFKFAFSSDDDYYLVGTNLSHKTTLMKINPTTFEYEEMLTSGIYDIYTACLNGENILFNALRMSDGAIVIGRIANDKSVTIIDENLSKPVTVLERIR